MLMGRVRVESGGWLSHACMLSHVQFFMTPQTAAHQAPLSLEFSRQEYWSGLLWLTLAKRRQERWEPHVQMPLGQREQGIEGVGAVGTGWRWGDELVCISVILRGDEALRPALGVGILPRWALETTRKKWKVLGEEAVRGDSGLQHCLDVSAFKRNGDLWGKLAPAGRLKVSGLDPLRSQGLPGEDCVLYSPTLPPGATCPGQWANQ